MNSLYSEGATYKFSIKDNKTTEYQEKSSQPGIEYTYLSLQQNKEYYIKVEVISKNGKNAIKEVVWTTGKMQLAEGNLFINEEIWNLDTHKARVQITKSSELPNSLNIQYSINGTEETLKDNKNWILGDTITGLSHGDIVYARLWDGTNSSNPISKSIVDTINPSNATIVLNNESTETSLAVTATVTHIDNESGVATSNSKWMINTTSSELGTNKSSYTEGTFSKNAEKIPLNIATTGIYYLHVLTTDNVGHSIETIKGPIIVEAKYHVHTGSSSSSGGCYTAPIYHSHSSSCPTTKCGRSCNIYVSTNTVNCPGCKTAVQERKTYKCSLGHYLTTSSGSCSNCGLKSAANYGDACKINIYSCNLSGKVVGYNTACGKNETTQEGYTVNY